MAAVNFIWPYILAASQSGMLGHRINTNITGSTVSTNSTVTITLTSHGLSAGDAIYFDPTAPGGFTANVRYFVRSNNLTANTFELTSNGTTSIAATTTGSYTIKSDDLYAVVMYAEEAFTATQVLWNQVAISGVGKTGVSVSVNNSASTFTVTALGTHTYAVGDVITFSGTAPGGFNLNQPYFIRTGVTSTTFTLASSSGGTALNTNSTGGGTYNVVSNLPSTTRIGLESVSATTGLPTGTYLSSGNAYVDKSTWSLSDNFTAIANTLGSSVSLNRGDIFAITFRPYSGTWGINDFFDIGWYVAGDGDVATPYVVQNYDKVASIRIPPATSVRSSTRAYGFPWASQTSSSINAASTAEQGIRFKLPQNSCTSFQVAGAKFYGAVLEGGYTFTMSLYQGTNRTALQQITFDSDQFGSTTASHYFYFDESTLSTLSPNTEYRLTFSTTTNAGVLSFRSFDFLLESDTVPYRGSDAEVCATSYSSGSYTDTTTKLLPVALLINDMTASASGGLLVHPGMAGGMRG